jgi:hypothetical protein
MSLIMLLLFFASALGKGVYIVEPQSWSEELESGNLPTEPKEFNITGEVIVASPLDACHHSQLNCEDLKGKIVIVDGKIFQPEYCEEVNVSISSL